MNPLLLDVPTEIETERLVLRTLRAGEGVDSNQAVVESFNELHAWMPWAKTMPTVEQSEEFCRKSIAMFWQRTELNYRGFLRESGQFAIGIGMHNIDWAVPRCEIGYWCRSSMVGRGLVIEAVNAMTTMAFQTLKMRRVEIRMDARNQRSWRVAERCGFELEGILRCDSLDCDGKPRDTRVYSKVRRDD
jgi:RimJ/RimL family protein N-acetyltransferase